MEARWRVTPGSWHEDSTVRGDLTGIVPSGSAAPLPRVCPVPLMWSGLLDPHW